jgi:hypothetical protein
MVRKGSPVRVRSWAWLGRAVNARDERERPSWAFDQPSDDRPGGTCAAARRLTTVTLRQSGSRPSAQAERPAAAGRIGGCEQGANCRRSRGGLQVGAGEGTGSTRLWMRKARAEVFGRRARVESLRNGLALWQQPAARRAISSQLLVVRGSHELRQQPPRPLGRTCMTCSTCRTLRGAGYSRVSRTTAFRVPGAASRATAAARPHPRGRRAARLR